MDESEREVEDAILGEDEAVDEASSTSSEGQTVTETTITADEEDTGADDSSDTGVPSSSGVDEALEAWVAGGHTIRCAPYATFGGEALSANALKALEGRRACLLANHGMIAAGRTLAGALALAVEVETLASQYCRALQLGEPKILSRAEMKRVLAKFEAGYGTASQPEAARGKGRKAPGAKPGGKRR